MNNSYNICYVILHYITAKDTIECIKSIENLHSNNKISIVVVDNASHNGSIEEVKEQTNNYENITYIENKENLGFAKGNNVGFNFAKYELNADFIVLLNNDTVIEQPDFSEKIVQKYLETGYAVLGPDIVTMDNVHQNPYHTQILSIRDVRIYIIKKIVKIILDYLNLISLRNKFIRYKGSVVNNETVKGDIYDTPLSGACLIFSKKYIDDFDGLNDSTFLYMEENILYSYSQHYNFLMLYSDELQILHKEHISTDIAFKNDRKKDIAQNKYLIQSSIAYLKILKKFNSK